MREGIRMHALWAAVTMLAMAHTAAAETSYAEDRALIEDLQAPAAR